MIVAILFILLGAVLAVFAPALFVLFFGLFGSDTEAMGFMGYFSKYVSYYDSIMLVLLFVALVSAVFRSLRNNVTIPVRKKLVLSIVTMIVMMLSVVLFFVLNRAEGSLVVRSLKAITIYGPAIFVIWILEPITFKNGKSLLFKYLFVQCAIAFAIIYLTRIGINFWNNFNSGYYNGAYYYTNEYNDMVALPSNFYLVFSNSKNENFLRAAQFHNSNGLGFAAATFMFLTLEKAFVEQKKIINKILLVFLAVLAFLLWCNSETKGVIVGILIGAFVYIFKGTINNRGALKASTVLLITGMCALIPVIAYLIFNEGDVLFSTIISSLDSRDGLMKTLFDNFGEFFLLGNGGNLDEAVSRNIDPHFLPFRIYIMYGIGAAVLTFILCFVSPIRLMFNKAAKSIYCITLLSIAVFVGSTNNLTAVALFWIILAEAFLEVCRAEKDDVEELPTQKKKFINFCWE
ncbi:MAG: hypothetical protein E7601_00125 [Ruminococcaceae bacterium]|nr:hypothetical protein [Oscillospiraceae bacterium]